MNPAILLIAGEASGDLLGAELIQAIQAQNSSLSLHCMGGPQMQKTGARVLIDSSALAVVGLWEVITHFFKLRRAYYQIKHYLKQQRPALVILIDYPGFNLRIAKVAHQLGIKVLFYVSPQIWAWRYHRIHHIKKYVDHMVVFFEFEKELYQHEKIPVTLVAHPLLKLTQTPVDTAAVSQALKVNVQHPVIALLPGSRQQEIRTLLPLMIATQSLIQERLPKAQFLLPLASSLSISDLQPYLNNTIQVTTRPAHEVLAISQAAIVASGTATLEAALMKTPMVIVYKVWGYALARRWFIKTPYIGLCNIAAQRAIAKELIQNEAKAELIAEEICRLIEDKKYRESTLEPFEQVKDQLGSETAATKVAHLALQMLPAE